MKRVYAYIVWVLQLFIVGGRKKDLTDITDYEPGKDIKIDNNYRQNEFLLDNDEDALLEGKFSDAESPLILQQYINDDDFYFDDNPSEVAHRIKYRNHNEKLEYIALLKPFAYATIIGLGLATLLKERKNIDQVFGIHEDINKRNKLKNSDVNKFPVIDYGIFGIDGDKLSTDLTNHSQESGHAPQSSLPNDTSFGHLANVESDYNNSIKSCDMNEYYYIKNIARLEEEAANFYRNAELSREMGDKQENTETDFLLNQNDWGYFVKNAEIEEMQYLLKKKLNGEFGEFMTTGREIYSDTLERKRSKLYENFLNRDGSNEPEIMAVANMRLKKIDNGSKRWLNRFYELKEKEKEFYPDIHTQRSELVSLLAHLKVLSPPLPVYNPNEFYIIFDKVSDSFTGKLEEQRIYKIEKLYGIGSTAVILGGRPIDKHNQPVGEPLALKIVLSEVGRKMKEDEQYLNRITTGEEVLLEAGAAKQKQLGLPLNAQSATERTGILFPIKSMSLTSKPGYILTRPDGGLMIHPKVYAYPAMTPSFDDALMLYEPSEREHLLDYFAKNLILSAAHMHSMGVVHLDEKPDNVLVGPGGRLYLCDFSSVRPIGDMFEEEKMMNDIFLDPEGLIKRNSISLATEAIDSWRIGLSILNAANIWEYDGEQFDPSSIDFNSISGLSKTLVDIVLDLVKPLRNLRLTPRQIIGKYPEFFGVVQNESNLSVADQKHL